ncbi:GntR family transcriptional regulator [Celerinatantimonas sp. MCCC 1A17872]|uniref:GntR family transcriptional regulator n=1 Tax=Celerinatantimonas sp. MCCC 1A17872 TaxID=3177514 RepID=UPI0038C20B04
MRKDRHHQMYQQMLKAIVEHQLPPGLRLPEDKLAATFAISRTGVRKVLQRLALEKFVTIEPNKGAHVSEPSVEEARQVIDSRIMLEPLLIGAVIDNWDESAKSRLQQLIDIEHLARHADDLAEQIDLTAQFHIELASISGNQVMADFVQQLAYRSSLVVAVYGSRHSVGCDCGDHQELLELLDERQVESSIQWMKVHLQAIKQSLNFSESHDSDVDFSSIFTPLD